MELATVYPEGRSAAKIAARRGIPAAYLSRLLAELSRAGWVRSRRGPGGGVTLARSPDAIPVTAVFASGDSNQGLPPALARLTDIITTAVEKSTAEYSVEDLIHWERQASTINDYSI